MPGDHRRYSAGSTIDDLCRTCKQMSAHTVFAVDSDGTPIRVVCDRCNSQHNYRGGERAQAKRVASTRGSAGPRRPSPERGPFPMVSERERSAPIMDGHDATPSAADLETLLRRIIREESGLTPVVPADKWRGGELVLRPGTEGLQEKSWPIETFFNKVVMLRNRLRVLEQQVNGSDLPEATKVKLQGYVTACYGSLTSFNVLFASEDDKFSGAAQD